MSSSKTNTNNVSTSNYSLHNKDNYKSSLTYDITEIMNKYTKLVFEYLLFIIENITTKNKKYNTFIISRGLRTISHVFSVILFYSKNVDMAYYHSQKSFYFYVEFMGQISEEQHSFLQLSSRDASIFVYKKTIFEIPSELKGINETIKSIQTLDIYKEIISILFNKLLENIDFNKSIEEKKEYIYESINNIENITKKIMNQQNPILKVEQLNVIYRIIEEMNNYNIPLMKHYKSIDSFLKKYCKNPTFELQQDYDKIISLLIK